MLGLQSAAANFAQSIGEISDSPEYGRKVRFNDGLILEGGLTPSNVGGLYGLIIDKRDDRYEILYVEDDISYITFLYSSDFSGV